MSTQPTIGNGRQRPFAVCVWGNPLARAVDQAEAVLVVGLVVVWLLTGIWWIARRRLDRHRWDQWERDWTAF